VLELLVWMVKSGLELVVWIIGGTEVVLNVDWGDGTACVVSCTNSSDMVVVTLNHTYTQTGNYTVASKLHRGRHGRQRSYHSHS